MENVKTKENNTDSSRVVLVVPYIKGIGNGI